MLSALEKVERDFEYLFANHLKGKHDQKRHGRKTAQRTDPSKTVMGDCYEAAGRNFLFPEEAPEKYKKALNDESTRLVHAEVVGQGKLEGVKFGHGWIESDVEIGELAGRRVRQTFVYDFSNGRELVMPKELYYYIGGIMTDNPKKYKKYTREEARKNVLKHGHWGHWDLDVKI